MSLSRYHTANASVAERLFPPRTLAPCSFVAREADQTLMHDALASRGLCVVLLCAGKYFMLRWSDVFGPRCPSPTIVRGKLRVRTLAIAFGCGLVAMARMRADA